MSKAKEFLPTKYKWFFGLRLIYRDGEYHGWYNPRKRKA